MRKVLRWSALFALLAVCVAVPAASADVYPLDVDYVAVSGGDGPTDAPYGWWTCHVRILVFEDVTAASAGVQGSDSCNHAPQRIQGQAWLDNLSGTHIAVGNAFDLSLRTYGASTTPYVHITHNATYYAVFSTTITLPYGQYWDVVPAGCSASNEVLTCAYALPFVAA